MAQNIRFTKDTVGQQALTISVMIILLILTLAAEYKVAQHNKAEFDIIPYKLVQFDLWHYVVGILAVSYLWGLANYEREPKGYRNARMAGVSTLIMGFFVSLTLGFLVYAFSHPEIMTRGFGS